MGFKTRWTGKDKREKQGAQSCGLSIMRSTLPNYLLVFPLRYYIKGIKMVVSWSIQAIPTEKGHEGTFWFLNRVVVTWVYIHIKKIIVLYS